MFCLLVTCLAFLNAKHVQGGFLFYENRCKMNLTKDCYLRGNHTTDRRWRYVDATNFGPRKSLLYHAYLNPELVVRPLCIQERLHLLIVPAYMLRIPTITALEPRRKRCLRTLERHVAAAENTLAKVLEAVL